MLNGGKMCCPQPKGNCLKRRDYPPLSYGSVEQLQLIQEEILGLEYLYTAGNVSMRKPKNLREGTLEWVPINQVFNFPLVEDLHILLPKVLDTNKCSAPFSAIYTYDVNDQLHIKFGA